MSEAFAARQRHDRGRRPGHRGSKNHTGHSAVFSVTPAVTMDVFEDGGGFPVRFLNFAYGTMGVTEPAAVLHVCAGSVRAPFSVDLRASVRPAVVADARALPFVGESFEWVIADPPYSRQWGKDLYGLDLDDYPAPGTVVREAMRVLEPGGRLGLLHYMVPPYWASSERLVGVWGITTGPGSVIRAWTVLEKLAEQPALGLLRDGEWHSAPTVREGERLSQGGKGA